MTHEYYIKEVIKLDVIAVKQRNATFGVVLVNHGTSEIIYRDHDRVKEKCDPTAHGEINAIRALCSKLQTLSLKNSSFYTTSEPCPTCLSAMIKAKVPIKYYGAETEITASLPIKAIDIGKYAKKYPIIVTGGILANECLEQRNKPMSQ